MECPLQTQHALLSLFKNHPVVLLPATPFTLYNTWKVFAQKKNAELDILTPLATAYEAAAQSPDLKTRARTCLDHGNTCSNLGNLHAALGAIKKCLPSAGSYLPLKKTVVLRSCIIKTLQAISRR